VAATNPAPAGQPSGRPEFFPIPERFRQSSPSAGPAPVVAHEPPDHSVARHLVRLLPDSFGVEEDQNRGAVDLPVLADYHPRIEIAAIVICRMWVNRPPGIGRACAKSPAADWRRGQATGRREALSCAAGCRCVIGVAQCAEHLRKRCVLHLRRIKPYQRALHENTGKPVSRSTQGLGCALTHTRHSAAA
jgi:hypothetical protein